MGERPRSQNDEVMRKRSRAACASFMACGGGKGERRRWARDGFKIPRAFWVRRCGALHGPLDSASFLYRAAEEPS